MTEARTPSRPLRTGGAYLGLADGAVESVVLLVVEQAEVQRAQGGCRQGGLRSCRAHTVEKRQPPLRGRTRCHGDRADCHQQSTCCVPTPPHPWEGGSGARHLQTPRAAN